MMVVTRFGLFAVLVLLLGVLQCQAFVVVDDSSSSITRRHTTTRKELFPQQLLGGRRVGSILGGWSLFSSPPINPTPPPPGENNNDDDDDDDEGNDEILDEELIKDELEEILELEDEIPRAAVGGKSNNVLGTPLQPCCTNVGGSGIGTGFYRNGYCSTGDDDLGRHTVCVQVTDEFLQYSKSVGNDLSTPAPQYSFPGLNGGDVWCLCAQRWVQAYQANKAPKVYLQATHEKTLDYIPALQILLDHAVDQEEAEQVLQTLNEQRAKLEKLL